MDLSFSQAYLGELQQSHHFPKPFGKNKTRYFDFESMAPKA